MKHLVYAIMSSFDNLKNSKDTITDPSIPILYLGNYPQYLKSYPKVITLGLNPSHHEFPSDSPFMRFREAENIETSKAFNEDDLSTYFTTLNNYFKEDPYEGYESYDRVLNGLNTSYYLNTAGNNALHTNICSPFSTDITWSKLKNSTQYTLSREGRKFWHRLVEILEPDMILCSIARKYLERISFKRSSWEIFTSITKKKDGTQRAKPYEVEVSEASIGGKKTYLVYGQPVQLPFGSLSLDMKFQLGEDLRSLFV